MKKTIFLFFAAILCATNAWAGPTFSGGCVYFHNKGGWNDSYKYICISHDSWTEPRSVTVITNTQLWYNALPTSGWNDAKYMSAMGHSTSKSASNFKVSSCNHYTKNVSLGDWGFYNGNAQMLTPANGDNNAALELTYMGNSYSSMNRTITVKAKVSTDNGSSFAEATSPGTLSASSFAFTSYTSCKSAKTLSSGKITCGYTANTSLTAADADGYIFAGWYDASGNKQTEELTLSLNPTADATYYAYYTRKALAEETHDVTVSYMCGATSIKASTTASGVGVSTASAITAPVIAGYNFSNWTLGSGVQSADANANPISITTKASGDYTLTANYTEIPKVTIYFVNNAGWSKIQAYAWGDNGTNASWAGVDITANKLDEKIGVYDVYSYTVVQGSYANVIFNDGSNQTKDYVWTDGNYYWYNEAEGFKGGTKEDAETKFSAPVVNTYTVVGSSAPLFGVAWEPAKAENDMTLVEGTKYELVKTDVSLTVGEIQYKVAVNHAWDEAYPSNNAILPISEAGKYTVTFTFDSNTKAVNATAELTEAAVVLPTVGVKGAWDGWAATTTLTGDDTSASATVNIATAGVYEFGLDVDGNFQASGATIDKANNSTVVTTNAGNMKLTANVLGEYTFTWTYETNTLTVTYPAGEEVEIAKKYYIAGTENLTGYNWKEDGLQLTKDGDLYKHTFSALPAGEFEFKVTNGTWTDPWGYSNLGAAYVEVSEGTDGEGNPNGNIKFTTEEAKNITVIFDATAGKITIDGLTEKTPVEDYYTIVGVTAITGIHWDPANEDNKMTKAGEVYTLTKTGLQLEAGDYEYKVAKNGKWGDGEYPNGPNEKVTIAENGVYTIVYTYTVGTSLTAVPTKTGEYTPDKPVYTVAGDAALCGTNWKADDTTNDMTDNGDGTFTWTKTGVKITGTVGFKVVKNHDFGNGAYPNDNWNIVPENYEGNAIYTVTITFTESSKDIAVTLTKTGDAAPAVITYVLMGVNGDWTNGIPMTVNPDNANEYVLKGQVIAKATDALKVVTITNGAQTAWCGVVDEWSDATYELVDDGFGGKNIVLEDGIYDFYFKVNDSKIYIDQTAYVRNVTNKYGTICLPYASASTSGATFYEVVGQEDGKVYLGSVNTLAAGVPYIFEKSANQIKVVYTGDKETTAGSANGLIGNFTNETVVPVGNYILYSNAFIPADGTTNKVNAYRAYLDLSAVEGGKPQPMPGRRYIGMDVQGENEATGFENIVAPEGQTIKAIVNGQLVIIRGGEMYNVQGQKL